MKTITFEIDCGDKTCAKEPGKFCAQLGSRKFGQEPVCMLFQVKLEVEPPESGWVQRCQSCMSQAKELVCHHS